MNNKEIVKILKQCIYRPNPLDHHKVSVASFKHAINLIAKKHIYCTQETKLSKISDYGQIKGGCCK